MPTAMAAFNYPAAVADVPGLSPSAKLKKLDSTAAAAANVDADAEDAQARCVGLWHLTQ